MAQKNKINIFISHPSFNTTKKINSLNKYNLYLQNEYKPITENQKQIIFDALKKYPLVKNFIINNNDTLDQYIKNVITIPYLHLSKSHIHIIGISK